MYAMLSKAFIILLVAAIGQGTSDPCATTNYINNWKRSSAYTTDSYDTKICDSFLAKDWYRVISGSGELMPTECVFGGFRCGTDKPIWLSNDTLVGDAKIYPMSEGSVVNRTAYAVDFFNCRAKSYTIMIKKCSSYYVYYLTPTDGCNSAYCFGSGLPCEAGTSSETGFSPNCQSYPNITVMPQVKTGYEITNTSEHQYFKITLKPNFTCIPLNGSDEFTYDIRFYINEVEIDAAAHLNVTFSNIQTAALLQQHWENTFKPNMEVKCSIEVRKTDFGSPGLKTYSEPFYAGIKVLNEEQNFLVKEGEDLNISVQATLPIACTYYHNYRELEAKKGCFLQLHNVIPNHQQSCNNYLTSGDILFHVERCSLRIPFLKWDQVHNVTVRGGFDSDTVDNRAMTIRLYIRPESIPDSPMMRNVWSHLVLPDIIVGIEDTEINGNIYSCRSDSDPYMTSFSGEAWSLNDDALETRRGEYIMYHHKKLPLQVNAYIQHCDGFSMGLCNCGIAVRSSDSIFVANFCPTKLNNETTNLRYVAARICDPNHLSVSSNGNTYTILLPTATRVTFSYGQFRSEFYGISNIEITPTQLDFGYTVGLCGNVGSGNDFVYRNGTPVLNNNPDMWEFAKSWRVKESVEMFEHLESLFNPDTDIASLNYIPQEYCICENEVVDGHNGPPIVECFNTTHVPRCGNQTRVTYGNFGGECKNEVYIRDKRSVEDKDEQPTILPVVIDEKDSIGREPLEWRNGLTEDIAKEKCKKAFEGLSAYRLCSSFVPSVDPQKYIEQCVNDMEALGDDSFLKVNVNIYTSKCQTNAERMRNLTQISSNTTSGEQKSILDAISESTCPDDCSSRGTCIKGVCSCSEGFHGDDCSLDKSQAPILAKSSFTGHCDASKKPCRKFSIPGINFFDTPNLTCRYRSFTVYSNNKNIYTNNYIQSTGQYYNSFSMFCSPPIGRRKRSVTVTEEIATGYFISVSNDGLNFTEELAVLVYDSTCYECNVTSLSCEELDSCPTKSVDDSSKTTNYTAIAIGVGIGSAIIISIILILLRKKCISRKPYIQDSSTRLPNPHAYEQAINVFSNKNIYDQPKQYFKGFEDPIMFQAKSTMKEEN